MCGARGAGADAEARLAQRSEYWATDERRSHRLAPRCELHGRPKATATMTLAGKYTLWSEALYITKRIENRILRQKSVNSTLFDQ